MQQSPLWSILASGAWPGPTCLADPESGMESMLYHRTGKDSREGLHQHSRRCLHQAARRLFMSTKNMSREERLGLLRHWARPPYRQVEVRAGLKAPQKPVGSGIAKLPSLGRKPLVLQAGGGTDFHNAGDAPAGTTTSYGGGNWIGMAAVLPIFWGSAWKNASLSPGVG